MAKTIKQQVFAPKKPTLLRVAAYARVSSAKDAMHHSLSAQVSHYSEYIQSHPGWEYAGVYADEAKTGTKDNRENFIKLLSECRAGRIDLILTKSISRFARNTVTLLETVRELKDLGVDVYFEEQNIHSASTDGELMLTILASFAQAESLSASENQLWRIKKNFEEGKLWNGALIGYRIKDGKYTIVADEAETVRSIHDMYLGGMGTLAIAKHLNESSIPTKRGGVWNPNTIVKILKNVSYTGNLLLQKTYRENYLTKRTLVNHGEKPKYRATDTHEPIIPLATFEAVQAEMARRSERFKPKKECRKDFPYTGLIVCGNCGKHYRRKTTVSGVVWVCSTYNTMGKAHCNSKQIPEPTLDEMTNGMDLSTVSSVTAENGNKVVFRFRDGTETTKIWKDRSRAESWTEEMKEQARQKTLERSRHNG